MMNKFKLDTIADQIIGDIEEQVVGEVVFLKMQFEQYIDGNPIWASSAELLSGHPAIDLMGLQEIGRLDLVGYPGHRIMSIAYQGDSLMVAMRDLRESTIFGWESVRCI